MFLLKPSYPVTVVQTISDCCCFYYFVSAGGFGNKVKGNISACVVILFRLKVREKFMLIGFFVPGEDGNYFVSWRVQRLR